jgi:Phytanoyl-CoA dioxygenase (PhyH)
MNFTLTEQQLRFFDVFGYLSLPGIFADEIDKISAHFDMLFQSRSDEVVDWVHETHENRLRRYITKATEKDAYLASLLNDHRITGAATSILGDTYIFTGSDASIYDCGTTFHQDGITTAKPKSINIKMALYLEALDGTSGALRVIPGSHHTGDKFFGKLTKSWMAEEFLRMRTEDVPAAILPSMPGDLLLWDYRLMHATAYGGNQRRMLALEFAEQ